MSLAVLSMSRSEHNMSMPDLTMGSSDPTTSLSWSSDADRRLHRAHSVDRQRDSARRKDPFVKLLAGSEIALGRSSTDVISIGSNSGSSHATSSAPPGYSNVHLGRRYTKDEPLTTDMSLEDGPESTMDSVASSGVPGPGYYSGKALKWLGERSLDAVDGLRISRRTYRYLARLKRWRKEGVTELTIEQQDKLFSMLDDALEMSRPKYSSLVNKAGAMIARALDDWILDQFAGPTTTKTNVWLSQIHCWLADRRLARSRDHGSKPPDGLLGDLLKAVTKVPVYLQDDGKTTMVIVLLARELAGSPYEKCHRWLAESLRRIVKQTQQTRPLTAEEMTAIRSIAERRPECRNASIASCRPWEVVLFAECASQSLWCTDIVRGPWGLKSVVDSLEIIVSEPIFVFARNGGWEIIDDLLASLLSLSRHAWLESTFATMPKLVDTLLRMLRRSTREYRFRSCTCIVFTLRNLTANQPATLDTPEAKRALATLAAAPTRRTPSTEEYYRKLVCGYARELLGDVEGFAFMPSSGMTSEAE